MKIERTKNAGRNMIFGTLLKMYQIVVPFLMRTVMNYFMGKGYLGLSGLFTSILHVLNLAELGVGSAMVYSMYQAIAEDDHERIDALMLLYRRYYRLIGLGVLAVGLMLVPALPVLVNKDVPPGIDVTVLYLMNLAATVLSYWLFAYRSSLIQAYQREDIISKVTIVANTVQYALQLVTIIIFKNYYLYVVVLLLGQILINVFTAIMSHRLYPDRAPRGKLAPEVVSAINGRIRDLFTSKVGAVVLDSCDPIIITAFLGLEVLAVYQNYYYVITALAALFMVFFKAISAGVGNSLATESEEKNYSDFLEISCLTLCTLGVCVCCMLCLYQPFERMSFGAQSMLSFRYVILYCVFFYVYELCRLLNVFKDAAGIWHSDRMRPLVVSLLNLVLNVILVRFVGLAGVLLSTIISYYFLNLPWLLTNVFKYVYKRGYGEYLREVAILALAMLGACAVSYAICVKLGMGLVGLLARLVVSMGIGTAVMFVVARRYSHLDRSIDRLQRMVPAIRKLVPMLRKVRSIFTVRRDDAWVALVALVSVLNVRSGLIEQYLPLGKASAALLVLVAIVYVARRGMRVDSLEFVLIMAYAALTALSTLVCRTAGISAIASALTPLITVCLLFEASGEERLWLTVRAVLWTLGIMVFMDTLSVILFPKGMYPTTLYSTYYFLGYKTQRTWVQVPLLGMAAALSWHDSHRVKWWVGLLFASSVLSTHLTGATMGTACLVIMAFGYVMFVLRERLIVEDDSRGARVLARLSDYRVWAIAFTIAAVALYIPPVRDLLMAPIRAASGKNATLSGRTFIWEAMLGLFLRSPLIGVGHVPSARYIDLTKVAGGTNPHSFYLSVLVSGGLAGVAIMVCAYRLLLRDKPPTRRTETSLLMLAVVGNLFLGMTSCSTYAMLTLPLMVLTYRVADRCGEGDEERIAQLSRPPLPRLRRARD